MSGSSQADTSLLALLANLFLRRFDLQLSRPSRQLVLPRPRAGGEPFACEEIPWRLEQVDHWLLRALRRYRDAFGRFDPTLFEEIETGLAAPWTMGWVDSLVAYAMIRAQHPSKVVQVGSGPGTALLRAALDDNAVGHLVVIDPSASSEVASLANVHVDRPVVELEAPWFDEMPEDSFLIVDGSHRVAQGSDATHLILRVLPRLRPGIVVAFHGIYLPDDYPVKRNVDQGLGYSEQYLVHAFLAFNRHYDVLWPGRWAVQQRRVALRRLFGDDARLSRHLAFWIRRGELPWD